MNQEIVREIFLCHNLGQAKTVKKIEVGFTNEVYLVNNKFILKVCKDIENEEKFEKEVFFYNFFKNKIPVPKIRVYDNSKKVYGRIFMIYPKIKGDNLYAKWHLLTYKQRMVIVRQLCKILKIINKSSYNVFVKKFNMKPSIDWHDKILSQIQSSLEKVEKKKLLSPSVIHAIKNFVDGNQRVLVEQKIALVYWDTHFDNIIIQGNKVVGILDFERTELASIDFVLNTVKRMVDYPKKYMSKEFEKFAKKEDYAQLLEWFEKFYPELFGFQNLDKRLKLYSIKHDLDTLIWYPKSKEVRQMIAKTINYSNSSF